MDPTAGDERRGAAEPLLSRRSLILGSVAAGAIVVGSASSARAFTYQLRSQAEHDALPITWGYPFASPADRRLGVDGYPGPTYSGHIGVDFFTVPRVGTPVLAVANGTVSQIGDDGEVGRGVFVVVQHAAGVRSEYLHFDRGSIAVRVGQAVSRWTPLGRTGWTGDVRPKEPQSGHLHLAIFSGPHRTGVVWNPVWLVADAPTPGGTIPEPTPTNYEDDMAYPFRVDNKHLFLVSPGFIKHFSDSGPADLTRNIVASNDEWISLGSADFLKQLDSFGVPRNMVDLTVGRVFDVSAGQMVVGGMWSWAREAQQNTRAILATLNNRP